MSEKTQARSSSAAGKPKRPMPRYRIKAKVPGLGWLTFGFATGIASCDAEEERIRTSTDPALPGVAPRQTRIELINKEEIAAYEREHGD